MIPNLKKADSNQTIEYLS